MSDRGLLKEVPMDPSDEMIEAALKNTELGRFIERDAAFPRELIWEVWYEMYKAVPDV